VSRESKQLMQQVERVLHLAKLEDGDYQLRMEEINLEILLKKVIQDMDLQINQKGALVSLNVNGQIPSIKGDQFHLSNAFRNIIDNALKYSQSSPEILIHIEQTPDGIKLLFQDNGIGISKADQEIIFDKFQRIGTGNVHQQKGFGLGLSYVKKIMDLHQGAIKIFSELNQGSRFDLYIPIART
jgi:two-component system phosphate regulon sensor histidine kinase PhoR